jgi:hypothetical protein
VPRRLLENLLGGVALATGIWLAMELRNPYSDVRLWLDDQLDTMKGVLHHEG